MVIFMQEAMDKKNCVINKKNVFKIENFHNTNNNQDG